MPRTSRQTKQKKELELVVTSFDSFFNAQEVAEKSQLPLATIYRFLNDQEKSGKLFSYSCDGRKIYSSKKRSHCHYICEKTGKVIHFDIDNLDFLQKHIPGTIESFQIEVRGVCDSTCDDECNHK
jgi:Fe2+ or Zn2+ uptake regulation protein